MAGITDTNLNNVLSQAQQFTKTVRNSIYSIMSAVNVSRFDPSYTQSGAQFGLGLTPTAGAVISSIPSTTGSFPSIYPRNYNIATMTPVANVLVKKRLFTTLAYDNDVRFMDSNERAFIRTSKNLFQLKAFQIATYESLTKVEQNLQQNKTLYIPSVLAAIQNASAFGALTGDETTNLTSALLQITQRDLAGQDTNLTTWIIDQFDKDLANIGRGVGVIEFTNFTKIDTNNKLDGGGSANIEFEDPYHIMMISSDDIEAAIQGAMYDNFTSTLIPSLAIDDLQSLSQSLQAQINSNDPTAQAQAQAAINTVQQTAADVLNAQPLSPKEISFVRKKMRKFYLAKAVIQPTDGIHIFMKSDTIYENDDDPVGLPLGLDRYGVDEEILKQEMYVVTKDRDFDIDLYRTLRDKNAFSGASVFAGVVNDVNDGMSDGFYTLSVSARNNLWYLEQSFVNTEPALDQSQGLLHDPLTPFKFEFDSFGNIKTTSADGSVGFQLLQDNIDRLSQVNFKYDNGNQRGNSVSAANVLTGNVPGAGIQQAQHYPGMLYQWKEGIQSVSLAMNTSDPTGLFFNSSKEVGDNTYGLAVTSTPFDNMDVANVVSLLVTGLPYNISTFINDSLTIAPLNSFGGKSSSDSNSYFDAFFNAVSKQNKVLGNFKPLLGGDSVNIDTIKQLAYKKVSFNKIDTRLGELQTAITDAQTKRDVLPLNINGGDNTLLLQTRAGLQAKIDELTTEQNALIQQYNTLDSGMNTMTANQDALGFSSDPATRETQLEDYQFRQLYVASRRIEDVRYNRDVNYFIVGTEYDSDTDIQAFTAGLRGAFKYFDNRYDPVYDKAKQAAKVIDFELFSDNSGNIRFRPPQYNKVPLSIYYHLFNLEGQQGITIIPDFVKAMFVSDITSTYETIVKANWQILIDLGKSGSDSFINALNAYVPTNNKGIVEFLGFSGATTTSGSGGSVVVDGNTTDQFIEFNTAQQITISRSISPSSKTSNILTLDVMNTIATQIESKFGTKTTLTQDDIIDNSDPNSASKLKSLFNDLKGLFSTRNNAIKQYLSQLNNLGVSPSAITSDDTDDLTQTINSAVQAKTTKLAQEIYQVVATGNVQGYTRPVISSEFANLVEDDTRNWIGRGSGRRFIIRDDSIKSYRITESQPDYCRVNVSGQLNFGGQSFGPSLLEGRALWAGAVDYDLWRQYGYKSIEDVKVPFLSDPENQLKPYAVFLLLKQRKKVMKGTITVIGNEYYQLGDVVYLADRDMLFYVVGVSQSYNEGEDFTTTLTLEYGRPPGEYIPTPLDAIGKSMLKQNTSSQSITKRQMTPDTFYFPLRPTPVVYMDGISSNDNTGLQKMLGTDSNQGRLINALMNANTALQKPNAILVITYFNTGSENDQAAESRAEVISSWFQAPKLLQTGLSGQNLVDFKNYNAIPPNKIIINKCDLTADPDADDTKPTDPSPDDIISSDQGIINAVNSSAISNGVISACQEVYALISDIENTQDEVPNIVEIGIYYQKAN